MQAAKGVPLGFAKSQKSAFGPLQNAEQIAGILLFAKIGVGFRIVLTVDVKHQLDVVLYLIFRVGGLAFDHLPNGLYVLFRKLVPLGLRQLIQNHRPDDRPCLRDVSLVGVLSDPDRAFAFGQGFVDVFNRVVFRIRVVCFCF
ncbi:hypothetical protein [Ruegeria sp.]|uniref:hypothetical protein n=1 Tax=Ruegeria sp. TaxID=1879320 RepID=UPI003B5BE127